MAGNRLADFPSGQRELTVNQPLRASVVRIHYPPRPDSSVVEHFLGKEEVVSPILTRGSQSPLDAVLGIHIHIVLVLTAVVQVVLMCFMMAVI